MPTRAGARFAAWLALLPAALGGCGGGGEGRRPLDDVQLRVAAASDLQSVLPALIERFHDLEPQVHVVPVFGASGQLARQIEAGAPFDLFLSANREFVARLAAAGVVDPASVRPYAIGSLVLVVGRGAGDSVRGLADLAGPAVKVVAIANPDTAPYGAAARQALQKAGLWETLGPKLAVAGSVRQALQYVETGNAEAGLVSRSVAGVAGIRTVAVDPTLHDPMIQVAGVVARTRERRSVDRFLRFVVGTPGRELLSQHGFQLPDAP